jgi:hypothetical protein
MHRGALALLALLFGACATTETTQQGRDAEPITYRAAPDALGRSVGKLRRLLVLPVQLDASPEAASCFEPCDPGALAQAVLAHSVRYLADWKDYEVAEAGAARQAKAAELHERLKHSDAAAQAQAAAMAREVGMAEQVDGVVLVTGTVRYLSRADAASWYYTFALSIAPTVARLGVRLEARIFASATGELVWASRLRVRGEPGSFAADYGEGLFSPIERALPGVMVERGEGAR